MSEEPYCSFCGAKDVALQPRPGWQDSLICEPCLAENYTNRPSNTPPADELFAVRAQLRELKEREGELKQLVLSDADARTGNHYLVELKKVVTNRVDIKELRAAYPEQVAEHTHPVTDIRVELRGIDEDGVITPIKRTRP